VQRQKQGQEGILGTLRMKVFTGFVKLGGSSEHFDVYIIVVRVCSALYERTHTHTHTHTHTCTHLLRSVATLV
jgi:hypothetical protein